MCFPSPPQDRVARRMLQCMPDRAVELVRQGAFPGADLVQVASDAHRPSFKEGGNEKKKKMDFVFFRDETWLAFF